MSVASAADRRDRAIRAAVEVARRHGLEPSEPTILQDWNNTVIRLGPLPLVAKVSTSPLSEGSRSLGREVSVAAHLAEKGAPVVPPSTMVPPGPHERDGLFLTFWEHVTGVPATEGEEEAAGHALRAIHEALSDLDSISPGSRTNSTRWELSLPTGTPSRRLPGRIASSSGSAAKSSSKH